MRLSPTLIVVLGAAAFGPTSSGLQAAPNSALNARALRGERPAVEQIVYRRCWWRYGERRCRLAKGNRPRVYGYRSNDHAVGRGRQENMLPPNLGFGIGSGL